MTEKLKRFFKRLFRKLLNILFTSSPSKTDSLDSKLKL